MVARFATLAINAFVQRRFVLVAMSRGKLLKGTKTDGGFAIGVIKKSAAKQKNTPASLNSPINI
jgi:hypothetical protein